MYDLIIILDYKKIHCNLCKPLQRHYTKDNIFSQYIPVLVLLYYVILYYIYLTGTVIIVGCERRGPELYSWPWRNMCMDYIYLFREFGYNLWLCIRTHRDTRYTGFLRAWLGL